MTTLAGISTPPIRRLVAVLIPWRTRWAARHMALPPVTLIVAFDGDDVSASLLRPDHPGGTVTPLSSFPRFTIAEMVDDIALADLRLLRLAFSLDEVTDALRSATGESTLAIVLGDREIVHTLMAGTMSRRHIGQAVRARRLTTSLRARDLIQLTGACNLT